MDYKYEQTSEVEALDSIYYGDMQIFQAEPVHKFGIGIKSEEYDEGEGLACQLIFTYTSKYPEELPILEIDTDESFDEIVDKEELYKHLMEQGQENLGMVMVFTLVSAGQEWLNEKWDSIKKEKEEKILAKKKAEEEAELKRFEGTRVTVESFLVWRKQFEIDMGIPAKREKESKDKTKLTGKELFLRDITLNESDLKFLEDGQSAWLSSMTQYKKFLKWVFSGEQNAKAFCSPLNTLPSYFRILLPMLLHVGIDKRTKIFIGDAVKVDESLFQDLDDLEISDEDDEDDEDYVPGQSSDSD